MVVQLTPLKLFLVEDNPADVDLTRLALEENRMSFHMEVASDGEEATQYLARLGQPGAVPPDLIILDLNVPKINGLDILKIIKSNEHTQLIPVIVLTTSSAHNDMIACYRNYANCYVTKPLDFEEFIEVIREIKAFWLTVANLPNKTYDGYSVD